MNPIVRMLKRYIKTPLRYALPLLFIGALVLSSTTGCISSNTGNQASELSNAYSTAYPTAGKSELLQRIVAYENDTTYHYPARLRTFTWINNTTVKEHYNYTGFGGEIQYSEDMTFIHFPTVSAASAYFDSNRPQYSQKSSSADYGTIYHSATGQDATVIKSVWDLKSIRSDSVQSRLEQFDVLIIKDTTLSHSVNQA